MSIIAAILALLLYQIIGWVVLWNICVANDTHLQTKRGEDLLSMYVIIMIWPISLALFFHMRKEKS